MNITLRNILRLFIIILFIFAIKQAYCLNVTPQWKTHNAILSQVSFSYPDSWTLIPETPNISGVLITYLESKNMLFSVSRCYDTTSKETFEVFAKKENERSKVREDSLFSAEKIVIDNDTCLKVKEIPRGCLGDEEISIICPNKNLAIDIVQDKYTPTQDSAFMPYIAKILTSIKILGRRALTGKLAGYCSNSTMEWRTYANTEIGISFSYPSCWSFIPRQAAYRQIILETKDVNLEIGRSIDSIGSKSRSEIINSLNYQPKKLPDKYNKENMVLGLDTFTKIR